VELDLYCTSCCVKGSKAIPAMTVIAPIHTRLPRLVRQSSSMQPRGPRLALSKASKSMSRRRCVRKMIQHHWLTDEESVSVAAAFEAVDNIDTSVFSVKPDQSRMVIPSASMRMTITVVRQHKLMPTMKSSMTQVSAHIRVVDSQMRFRRVCSAIDYQLGTRHGLVVSDGSQCMPARLLLCFCEELEGWEPWLLNGFKAAACSRMGYMHLLLPAVVLEWRMLSLAYNT